MKSPGKHKVSKRVIVYEGIGFLSIILFIWLDEMIDLPHRLLGAEPTPVNWRESLLESAAIILLATVILRFTARIFQRMKYLEGILSVCASCKKVRDTDNHWQPIEAYIRDRSDAEFTHSICPECAAKLYPDFNPYLKVE